MVKRFEDVLCLTEAECLLIDPTADQETLLDHAEQRLDAVKDLMFTLTSLEGRHGALEVSDLANLAVVSRFLLADASDLLTAARRQVRQKSHRCHAGGGHV